jgi:hypothetical protein
MVHGASKSGAPARGCRHRPPDLRESAGNPRPRLSCEQSGRVISHDDGCLFLVFNSGRILGITKPARHKQSHNDEVPLQHSPPHSVRRSTGLSPELRSEGWKRNVSSWRLLQLLRLVSHPSSSSSSCALHYPLTNPQVRQHPRPLRLQLSGRVLGPRRALLSRNPPRLPLRNRLTAAAGNDDLLDHGSH